MRQRPCRSALPLLLGSTALLLALPAHAQVEIDDARTAPVRTSTAGPDGGPSDVVITDSGSVTVTDEGPAVVLDSDNSLDIQGNVTIEDVDNATAVELQGGADREFTLGGDIAVTENVEDADTDDDPFNDNPYAEGEGRRGVLVSGASPFQGNITVEEAGSILVEGNNSVGIDLANTPVGAGLEGSLTNNGAIVMRGADNAGVRVASGVTGDVVNNGTIDIQGAGSAAFDIGADIGGGLRNTNRLGSTGYRFTSRLGFNPDAEFDITDLDAEDLGTAGSVVRVTANVDGGIEFAERRVVTEDADGNEVETVLSRSQVVMFGSAPAILIDGEGTPIAIGRVSDVTDPDAADFDAERLYAFVHTGEITADGVFDEFDATVMRVSDATLEGGIFNSGTLTATTTIGSERREIDGVELGTGLSRVIVLGDNAIADAINNRGVIIATAQEAADQVYFDPENLPAPRALEAVAIDVAASANLTSIENTGVINALLIGRDGTATVIRDESGSLSEVINRGFITATGRNSDPDGNEETDFTLIALDVSANTGGVSFLQELREDDDPDDDITPVAPLTAGELRFGAGDDTVTATAGAIIGNLDFGAGDDTLTLAGADYSGQLSNAGGLDIAVTADSTLALAGSTPVDITSASFADGTTFRPTIDGDTGTASTLQASGAISFAAGANINPVLNNLINSDQAGNAAGTDFAIATASDLTVGDLAALNAGDDGSFLFDTSYQQVGDTLVVTVDLREAGELGLDTSQTGIDSSVFGATLQALQSNRDLGNEFANIGAAGDFYAAYNQLLPEFAAAPRQFVIANTDGAVGAVGNHLDAARRSPERPGGAWIQEFAYFADRDLAGLSEQFRGEGFGFAGGLDTEIGPFHAVGVNLAFASTEIEDVIGVDEPLDVTTLIAGLYAGYASGPFSLDAYVGGGFNEFEQNRRVIVGEYVGNSSGEWDGTHINGSLRAGYEIALSERFWVRPVASLDYLRLTEDAFSETGDVGVALSVDERTSEMAAVSGLLNFGATFQGRRTWIRPSLRVGYRNEFLSDPVLTSYRFANIDAALAAQTQSADFPSSGVLLGFSVAAGSGFSSVGFDFDSDIRDGFIRHTGRIVVRLLF